MSEHTPEPWSAGDPEAVNSYETTIYEGPVAKTGKGIGHLSDVPHRGVRSSANARRIVACVNALAGIDDPAAFRRAVDELVRIGDHALGVIDECWRFAEGDEQERESIRQARLHLAHALAAVREQMGGGSC